MTSPEQNKALVREAFEPWTGGDSGRFFDLIADEVHWEVIGSTPFSGVFESEQALLQGPFAKLTAHLDGPLTTRFIDIAADGDRVFLRFESTGHAKNGVEYDQSYCWAMRMADGRITEIVAYLDPDLLNRVLG